MEILQTTTPTKRRGLGKRRSESATRGGKLQPSATGDPAHKSPISLYRDLPHTSNFRSPQRHKGKANWEPFSKGLSEQTHAFTPQSQQRSKIYQLDPSVLPQLQTTLHPHTAPTSPALQPQLLPRGSEMPWPPSLERRRTNSTAFDSQVKGVEACKSLRGTK